MTLGPMIYRNLSGVRTRLGVGGSGTSQTNARLCRQIRAAGQAQTMRFYVVCGNTQSLCRSNSRGASSRRPRTQRSVGGKIRRGALPESADSECQMARSSQNSTYETLKGETQFVAETLLPTRHGLFRLRGYKHTLDNWVTFTEPTAIICGEIEGESEVPLRVHDACFTSEVLGSLKCDCAEQLEIALTYLQEHPPGMVIYLQQEGRGIGLANKIAAYAMQETGLDTVDANTVLGLPVDCREYTSVANILKELRIKSIRLMTNNPRKVRILEDLGLKIVDRIPCLVQPGKHNQGYLEAKEKRLDHLLDGSWCYWEHNGAAGSPTPGNQQFNPDADLS